MSLPPSFCLMEQKFCLCTSLCKPWTTTSRIWCNRNSSVAGLNVLGLFRSNNSRYMSGPRAVLSLFRITAGSLSPLMSLYWVHVSMNNSQSPSLASSPIQGRSDLLTRNVFGWPQSPCFLRAIFSSSNWTSCFISSNYYWSMMAGGVVMSFCNVIQPDVDNFLVLISISYSQCPVESERRDDRLVQTSGKEYKWPPFSILYLYICPRTYHTVAPQHAGADHSILPLKQLNGFNHCYLILIILSKLIFLVILSYIFCSILNVQTVLFYT